jgi:hypothetical protein
MENAKLALTGTASAFAVATSIGRKNITAQNFCLLIIQPIVIRTRFPGGIADGVLGSTHALLPWSPAQPHPIADNEFTVTAIAGFPL